MADDIRISVRGLTKRFTLGATTAVDRPLMTEWMRRSLGRVFKLGATPKAGGQHDFWALRDVSFEVREGQRLGIIGRNGAGKSTLLKILSRLMYPTAGEARIRGRVTALLEVGVGFNPVLSGRENVFLNAAVYGLSRQEIARRFEEIVDFSGVGEFIDEPVKTYSSGMRARLGFAVAAHLDPDVLILDEVLAVGDLAFAQKCLQKVRGLTSGGRTVVFVSHSLGDVVRFCDSALWLERGQIVCAGSATAVTAQYGKSMLQLTSIVNEATPSTADAHARNDGAIAGKLRGGPAAELIEFRIADHEGRNKEVFLRSEDLGLIVKYRVLRPDVALISNIHVMRDGVHVLTTHPHSPIVAAVGSVVHSKVSIPPQFLNSGTYAFSLRIVSPTRPITRHVVCDEALRCNIVERIDDRSIFSSDYRGVVRPEFAWEQAVHATGPTSA